LLLVVGIVAGGHHKQQGTRNTGNCAATSNDCMRRNRMLLVGGELLYVFQAWLVELVLTR
jgi:hypothetical protein